MRNIVIVTTVLCTFNGAALAHSGGTDSNGCHAGSQPFHCHNGSTSSGNSGSTESDVSFGSLDAWDLNLGYRYNFDGASPVPYFGLSIGKQYGDEDIAVGADLGVKFRQGFYLGYASTSNSVQLGFNAIHLSVNNNSIGLGIRFPFDRTSPISSTFYFSGSGLVGTD